MWRVIVLGVAAAMLLVACGSAQPGAPADSPDAAVSERPAVTVYKPPT